MYYKKNVLKSILWKLRNSNLEFRLRRDVKKGRLTDISKTPRQVGKSSLLVQIARETGATIICPSLDWANYFRRRYPDVTFITAYEALNGMASGCTRKYLLEECIPIETIKNIQRKGLRIIGGYKGVN